MSSFDELQRRVEAAERQFNAISRQRRDYGQRLIDMIAMHERNLAESGEQVHVLRQEAAEARALAEERGRALEKARGENEQLRHMLHSLLTAIERNRSNDFEETMLELDRRISSMVAADSDSVARAADSAEASQAPEAWTPAREDAAGPDEGSEHEGASRVIGAEDAALRDGDAVAGEAPAGIRPDAGAQGDLAAAAGGFDDLVAADWPDETDLPDAVPAGLAAAGEAPAVDVESPEAGLPEPDLPDADLAEPALPGPAPADPEVDDVGLPESGLPVSGGMDAGLQDGEAAASPLSLEEVLELAEASAEAQGEDAFSGIDGDRLTPEDLATLTEMLEESVAAAEEQTADDDAPPGVGDAPLNQSSIANIADLIRAEQAAGMAAPEVEDGGVEDGGPAGEADGDGGEDTRFELLDEEELQKGMTADRLFSADDYAEEGFGPVAAAEAEAEAEDGDDAEADDENAFDLSDLDLGGEIDGPPEAESEEEGPEGARAAGDPDDNFERDFEEAFEVIDDGAPAAAPDRAGTGAGSDGAEAVTAEEEAELERWRAEVLGRVAQEAQEAAAARQGKAAGRAAGGGPAQGSRPPGGMTRGGPARGPDAEEDNALAELDAILAEEDLSYAAGSGGEWSAAGAGETSEAAPDLDPAFHVELDDGAGPDLDIPPVHGEPRGGGLAPALREKLDADTRAEILARVRQSHGNGRDPGN